MDYAQDPVACPWCEEVLDVISLVAWDHVGEPAPGDVSICFPCGGLTVFDAATHAWRKPDLEEADEILNRVDTQEAMAARFAQRARGYRW